MYGRAVHAVVSDEAAARAVVTTALTAAGLRPGAVRRIPPSLEDVFVALVRREGGAVAG